MERYNIHFGGAPGVLESKDRKRNSPKHTPEIDAKKIYEFLNKHVPYETYNSLAKILRDDKKL